VETNKHLKQFISEIQGTQSTTEITTTI